MNLDEWNIEVDRLQWRALQISRTLSDLGEQLAEIEERRARQMQNKARLDALDKRIAALKDLESRLSWRQELAWGNAIQCIRHMQNEKRRALRLWWLS